MVEVESLSEKLKRLGVNTGIKDLKSSKPRDSYPVEDILPGRFINTDDGAIYFVENEYSPEYQHGKIQLKFQTSLNMIAEWAGYADFAGRDASKIVYLDTETSGLAGGTGTFAFMVGVGRYIEDSFQVGQFFMGDPLEEPALLIALEEFLAPYEILVTFNGKSFDVPLLNTRYILQGWESPFKDLFHIDLLHLARKLWRYRLPSRTLGDLEVQILEAYRTEQEVPGWMIPQMYFDYLRSRDARPLKRIFYHNEIDVLSMAALLKHTSILLENVFHLEDFHQVDRFAIARLYEDLGHHQHAIEIYRECLQGDLPDEIHLEAIQHLSFLHKRLGDYSLALELWKEAASKEQIYAFIELAKYYEHTSREYSNALYWTELAINIIQNPNFPNHERHVWAFDLKHRQNRLINKITSRE